MQDIDKDIDELYNSAAEYYPLRTDGKSWDKVVAGLQAAKNPSPLPSSGNKRAILVSGLLILLITTGLLYLSSNEIILNNDAGNNATGQLKHHGDKPAANSAGINKTAINSDLTLQEKSIKSNTASTIKNAKHIIPVAQHHKNTLLLNNYLARSSSTTNITPIPNKLLVWENEENIVSENDVTGLVQTLKNSTEKISLVVNEEKLEKSDLKSTSSLSIKVKPVIANRFYAGVIGSPQFSLVQKQEAGKLGVAYGLISGYKLNNTVSAEIGLIRSHMYYHTSGQFFSRENLKLKNSTTIEKLNGYNKITSVPVSVRVNFQGKKQQDQFFATAGAATYFLHEESYDYTLNKAGNMAEVNRNYNKGKTRMFSNVVLSTGYEKKITEFGRLRVEPYYSIPVKGVGVGNVSVSSMGINVGYVTDLHIKNK